MVSTERFARSKIRFFNSPQVARALDRLAASDSIVIYCGAGVTIDYTGLDWGRLNAGLFTGAPRGFPTADEARRLLRYLSPLELSSVLEATYAGMTPGGAAEGRRTREARTQDLLYSNSKRPWESGRLARTVIRLAAAFIGTGRRATILTTNQDAFLETSYAEWLEQESLAGARGDTFAAELSVKVVGEADPANLRSFGEPEWYRAYIEGDDDDDANAAIELVYLHGRIPPAGETPRGFIPNGEVDFDARHEVVASIVEHYFGDPTSNVLILGSGLRDQPVVSGLARSRRVSRGVAAQRRFAVAPLPGEVVDGTTDKERTRLAAGLSLRGEHLGVTLLQPDFHSQIPQFCEEILGRIHSDRGVVIPPYQDRADSFYDRWSAWNQERGPRKTFKKLRASFATIEDILRFASNSTWQSERMRLELWVHHPQKRQLRVAASTTGELRTPQLAREADLSRATGNASVRAFVEGRPVFSSFDELKQNAQGSSPAPSSMWPYYLSVPIEVKHEKFTMRVGVVTLALRDEDSIVKTAVDTWPRAMTLLVDEMRGIGVDLLSDGPPVLERHKKYVEEALS